MMTAISQAPNHVSGPIPTQAKVVATLKILTQQASLATCQDDYRYRTIDRKASDNDKALGQLMEQEAHRLYPTAQKITVHILANIELGSNKPTQKLYYVQADKNKSSYVQFYKPVGQLYQVYSCRIK